MKLDRPARRLVLVLVCLALPGCRTTPPRAALLLDVPFLAQHQDYCGSASLAMVLQFHGRLGDEERIAADVHLPALHGTIPELLAEAARKTGLQAHIERGSPEELRRWLADGTPPIVLLGAPRAADRGHFVVVTGVADDGEEVYVHSGRRANQPLAARTFHAQWKQGGFTALLIRSED